MKLYYFNAGSWLLGGALTSYEAALATLADLAACNVHAFVVPPRGWDGDPLDAAAMDAAGVLRNYSVS